MKNTKILIASILASSLVLTNMPMMPTYAKDTNTNVNEQVDKNTNENKEENTNNSAPTIEAGSFTIDKNDVKPGDTINISVKVKGNTSDIDNITLSYNSQSTSKYNNLSLYYNPETDLYTGTITIDDYMMNGIWSVRYMGIIKKSGEIIYIDPSLYNTESTKFNVNNDHPDTTAPVVDLSSLKVDKKDAKPGDTVNISLKASDTESGINNISMTYESTPSSQLKVVSFKLNAETGLYEGTLDIDDSFDSGTWRAYYMFLSDKCNNSNALSSTENDLSNANFNVINEHKDEAERKNIPKLDLSTLKMDKNDVKPDDLINLTLATEDNSYVGGISLIYKSPISSSETWVNLNYNSDTNLYEGSINIWPYMEEGQWTIDHIQIYTPSDDYYYMYSSDYDFSNGNFNVTNENSDSKAPVLDLNSLKVNKKSVQVGDTITTSFIATDDLAGISSIGLTYKNTTTSETIDDSALYNKVTGLYENTFKIDENMEPGIWTLDCISLSDNAGNFVNIHATDYDLSNADFNIINN